MDTTEIPSTRPYLIRALYDWCTDSGFTPYVAVAVNESVRVPMEHVKDGEIVLNISMDATSSLKLGNEFIEFKARFGGVAREILVPVDQVLAIFARENGQGMAFPRAPALTASGMSPGVSPSAQGESRTLQLTRVESAAEGPSPDNEPPIPPRDPSRPALKRVK